MKAGDRAHALAEATLYFVAPGTFPPDVLAAVVDAGVDLVQLRMKDAEAAEVLEAGEPFMGVCDEAQVPFVVNDRPDIALALGADGVHLGQGDLPPSVARAIVGPDVLIGRSTHSTDDLARAIVEHERGNADYIACGPVSETPTKPGRPAAGIGLVERAAEIAPMPWFAIGGIDPGNIGQIVEAGAKRIVVVRAITEADDPVAAVRALKRALG